MSIFATDELPVTEIPSTEKWQESYAIMFGDGATGVCVFFSCGRVLSDPTIFREVIGVMLPDGRIFYAKNYGRQIPANGVGASLAALTVPEAGRRLRLTYRGPMIGSDFALLQADGGRDGAREHCTVDLLFDATTPIWDMAGDSKEASTIAGSMHIEQIGRASGTIEIGHENFTMSEGYAVRDHSRGVRDVSQYKAHCWGNGPLGDGRYCYFYGMELQCGAQGMYNAVIADGENLVPAQLHAEDLMIGAVDPQRPYKYRLSSEIGDYSISMTAVVASFPYSMIHPYDIIPGWVNDRPAAHMFDQLTRYECNGVPLIGWLERGYANHPL